MLGKRFAAFLTALTALSAVSCGQVAYAADAAKAQPADFFGDHVNSKTTQMTHFDVPPGTKYVGVPAPMGPKDHFTYVQPWSGYCPPSTLPKAKADCMTCQTANIKGSGLYDGIEVGPSPWVEMACDEARQNVENGNGPFAAVVVQIDDETGNVIRYWKCGNHVVEWCDPVAHAETTVLRAACKELGVMTLNKIEKSNPNLKLPQTCKTSHCDFYASTEPCPMCYTAVRRTGITTIMFGSTRFDAGVQGIDLPLDHTYFELNSPYRDRAATYGVHVYQSTVPNSLDGYNLYKRSNMTKY